MERWLAQGLESGGEHEQGKEKEANIERIDPDGEESYDKVNRAPDKAKDGGVANFLSGADD
jgi:hypothetical protein